jgi:TP901 family phage tail tape measure protein
MPLEASEVAVRVRLIGGAAFKAEADGVSRSVSGIGAAGKKADIAAPLGRTHSMLTKVGAKASKVGSAMIGMGRTMAMAGVPIAALGYYAAKASSSFQQAMMLLVTQAGLARKSLGPLSASVMQMSAKFGATPTAMAQALYPITSIGDRGKKALLDLKAAAIGSAVGLDSLENTADAVTTVMASHIKGSGGPVEAMAIMDQAIGRGKMHLVDLTESFKSGIVPISQQFGMSFKQILAAASGLTRVGIPANQVMARMRLTLTSMVAPTSAGQKAMSSMGLSQFQLAGDLRKPGGLITALKDLKKHADRLPKDQRNNAIAEMFGKSRGMASIGSLLAQLPQIDKIYGQVMGTTPKTLMEHFGETKSTSAFNYKKIQSEFYTGMIRLGNEINRVLLPILVRMVPYLTAAVKWFGQLSPGLKKFFLVLAASIVVGGPLLMFTGALVKTAGIVLGAGGKVYKALMGLRTASELAAGGETAGGLGGFALALRKVIPMLGLFGLALAALPIMKNQAHRTVQAFKNLGTKKGRQQDTESGFKRAIGMNGGTGFTGPSLGPQGSQLGLVKKLFGWIPGLASGGTVMNSGLAMVGETGPELLSLPRGAVVHPNVGPSNFRGDIQDTMFPRMPSGSDAQTIISQLVVDGKVLAESVNNVNRKKQNRR